MIKKIEAEFLKLLGSFPKQIEQAIQKISNQDWLIEGNVSNIQNILFVGMGGSGIVGDLVVSLFKDQLKIPFVINKSEVLPAFVGKQTLVIGVSYSGNTVETLHCVTDAIERGAFVVSVSSDGALPRLSKNSGGDVIPVSPGSPPRMALGELFFSVITYLNKAGFILVDDNEIEETIHILKSIRDRAHPSRQGKNCLSFKIARALFNTLPFIYTANSEYEAVLRRWKNQFEENAKSLAHHNVIPEMNHNEIMGWEGTGPYYSSISVIFLQCENLSNERKKRLDMTKKLIQEKCNQVIDVFPEGKSKLARVFSLIYMGDWISFFLAQFYKQDPIKISSINKLKEGLKNKS